MDGIFQWQTLVMKHGAIDKQKNTKKKQNLAWYKIPFHFLQPDITIVKGVTQGNKSCFTKSMKEQLDKPYRKYLEFMNNYRMRVCDNLIS